MTDLSLFSDAPYIVCVSGHLLFTGLSRISLNNREYFSLDNPELI